jgi:hypothetical protein
MGNVIKVDNTIIDVCYGMRFPFDVLAAPQPIISEFNMETGQKLLDITIANRLPELVNIMYQVNRGINIYEN